MKTTIWLCGLVAIGACGSDPTPSRATSADTSVASDTSATRPDVSSDTGADVALDTRDTSEDTAPVACGNVTFEGCCRADGRLAYCVDDELTIADCPANETSTTCGWSEDAEGFDCSEQGAPSSSPDDYPYLCDGETAPASPCAGRECGFAFGQACGAACGAGLACNEAGHCADPCIGKVCGTFAGKQCGSACTGGTVCSSAGQCVADTCGNLGFEGCCDGDVTYWCEDNAVVTEDCRAEYDTGCGWVPFDEDAGDGDFYYCDGSGSDPSQSLAKSCDSYTFVKPTP